MPSTSSTTAAHQRHGMSDHCGHRHSFNSGISSRTAHVENHHSCYAESAQPRHRTNQTENGMPPVRHIPGQRVTHRSVPVPSLFDIAIYDTQYIGGSAILHTGQATNQNSQRTVPVPSLFDHAIRDTPYTGGSAARHIGQATSQDSQRNGRSVPQYQPHGFGLSPFPDVGSFHDNLWDLDPLFSNVMPTPGCYRLMPRISDDQITSQLASMLIRSQQVNTIEQCGVCLESFVLGETVLKLPCEHLFHSNCIVPWLRTNNTCLICRGIVLSQHFVFSYNFPSMHTTPHPPNDPDLEYSQRRTTPSQANNVTVENVENSITSEPSSSLSLTDEEISAVPSIEINIDHANNTQQCGECLEILLLGETARQLQCEHRFHDECLVRWLRRHNTCPVCSDEVTATQNTTSGTGKPSSLPNQQQQRRRRRRALPIIDPSTNEDISDSIYNSL